MVGSALVRKLNDQGFDNIVTRTSAQVDLRNQTAVKQFFASEKPEFVFLAAARVGGIVANNIYRADFIYDNLMIQSNVIQASHEFKTEKLLFLGSSCIYPKLCPQPIKEEYLLTGELEPTNEPYALAKIAGLKMCESFKRQYGSNFIAAMPTNLYGPNDNYDLNNSHVLPALIRKFYEAKQSKKAEVEIWGTGKPLREFLHVDDLAEASLFLMLGYEGNQHINIGTGTDISIYDLAHLVKEAIGYTGKLTFNADKPDGTPRKLLDVSRINALGWKHSINLLEGVTKVIGDLEVRHFSFER